jgi:hypothetical protein
MSRSELQTSIQKQEGMITRAENKFDAHVRVMQAVNDVASRDHENLAFGSDETAIKIRQSIGSRAGVSIAY